MIVKNTRDGGSPIVYQIDFPMWIVKCMYAYINRSRFTVFFILFEIYSPEVGDIQQFTQSPTFVDYILA